MPLPWAAVAIAETFSDQCWIGKANGMAAAAVAFQHEQLERAGPVRADRVIQSEYEAAMP